MEFITEMWNGIITWASQTNPMEIVTIVLVTVLVGYLLDILLAVLTPLVFPYSKTKQKKSPNKWSTVLLMVTIALTIGMGMISILWMPDINNQPIIIFLWDTHPEIVLMTFVSAIGVIMGSLKVMPKLLLANNDCLPDLYRKLFKI